MVIKLYNTFSRVVISDTWMWTPDTGSVISAFTDLQDSMSVITFHWSIQTRQKSTETDRQTRVQMVSHADQICRSHLDFQISKPEAGDPAQTKCAVSHKHCKPAHSGEWRHSGEYRLFM
jgi:hypothetical protein